MPKLCQLTHFCFGSMLLICKSNSFLLFPPSLLNEKCRQYVFAVWWLYQWFTVYGYLLVRSKWVVTSGWRYSFLPEESLGSGAESDIDDTTSEEKPSEPLKVQTPLRHYDPTIDTKLPDTVSLLTTPEGGKVYLVGTAHFSMESQEDVAKVRCMSRKKLIPATSIFFLVCEKLRMEDIVNSLLCSWCWGVRFVVVAVVLMKMHVCWGITACCLVNTGALEEWLFTGFEVLAAHPISVQYSHLSSGLLWLCIINFHLCLFTEVNWVLIKFFKFLCFIWQDFVMTSYSSFHQIRCVKAMEWFHTHYWTAPCYQYCISNCKL